MKDMEKVFVNRTLNLKKIQYIGFDMDHTLIRYQTHNFEALTHQIVLNKLVKNRGYPKEILSLPFDFSRVIRGLVLDRKNGNLLKLNRYSGIRLSYHGTKRIDFATQKKFYKSTYIDLSDPGYLSVDTAFSVSLALLFAQLVDLKDTISKSLPDYQNISIDIEESVDEAHRDGTLKETVQENLPRFIRQDPDVVKGLLRFKKHDKKLFILTNSDYPYMKVLLDYTMNPFLPKGQTWMDLFDIVISSARKPRFFYDQLAIMKINPKDGSASPFEETLTKGIYKGGNAMAFTQSLQVSGEDILYIGDHIYGDILRLKKDCNWRTALVVDELEEEMEALKKSEPLDREIAKLMEDKRPLEDEVLELLTKAKDDGHHHDDKRIAELQGKVAQVDKKISILITKYQETFNPHWGEIMRAGAEESYFAYQVERYACIYMAQIKYLLSCSPRIYFRAFKRTLPHEAALL